MDRTAAYVTGGTALIGRSLAPQRDAVIAIRNGRIEAAGGRPDVSLPAAADVVDATGTTLIPGFIDAHVHIGFYDPLDVLADGVTTARDLGWPPEIVFPMSRRSASPGFPGPHVLAAGPMLTAPDGYPTRAAWAPDGTGLVISTPRDAADAVADLAAEKAAIVKVALDPGAGPVLPAATLKAVVKEAHVAGMKVTGHVAGLAELTKAVDAGMDELAHMLMSAERIPDDLLKRMVDRGMRVVPTLAIRTGRERRTATANLRRFREAGGEVVYGTDLGNEGVSPGIDGGEVRLMEKAGMSVLDVVRSATVASAEWLGLHDRGAIEPGMVADLVAVDGDATRAADLAHVKMVWRGGRRIR